jgi:iron(III) transport system ATP-binding protein
VNAVRCTGVRKTFAGVEALRGVDLDVTAGNLAAVLGPSGCGKTTLLRVIAGFERPDAGTVVVGDRLVAGSGRHVPPERRRVGIVPQEQALFPHLSVAGNVAYGLERGWRTRRDAVTHARVEAMLELTGLTGLGTRMPHELSGGQQQRVALARALAPEPSVVLLDEPFAGLDAALRASLRQEVAEILRAAATTALVVTHDQEEALAMADTVAVMREGAIVQHAAPDDVYHRPADLWVASFVGGANILPGRALGPGRVTCALGTLACSGARERGPVSVVVRPEQITLSPAQDNGAVVAVVEQREYFGHDSLVRVALPDGTRVLARTANHQDLQPRAQVSVNCQDEVACFPDTGNGAAPQG